MPNAFERARRGTNPPPATRRQKDYIESLARKAGIETPVVAWAPDASQVIDRLEDTIRQPTLTEAA